MIFLFNKPYGVVTQFSPHPGHKTLADFGLPKRIYPAGRLDHDSEGLLLLTDDGMLQNRLTDPKHYHKRTYLAQVDRIPDLDALEKLRRGPKLADGPTRPCRVQLLPHDPDLPPRDPPIRFRKNVPTSWLEITLTEGRNRQVRRMTAAIGHPTLRLVRVRIGPFRIEGLPPGKYKQVSNPGKLF
ncbi:MAG: pseudouridine synthase [Elusimicrobia bacterium]|nr:pseudouridine synthase [Elusimicrobiota bacterium]